MKKILVVAAIVAALILGSEVRSWWEGRKRIQTPVYVEPTKRIAQADVVQVPVDLQIPKLPEKTLKALQKEYRRPDLVSGVIPGSIAGSVVLGEWKIDCPPGVTEVKVLGTVEPSGRVEMTARPEARPFLGMPLKYRFGLDLDWADTMGGQEPGLNYDGVLRKWEAWAKLRTFRVGRIEVSPRVSTGSFFGIEYYGAGLSITTP